jgi:hypothetical protein
MERQHNILMGDSCFQQLVGNGARSAVVLKPNFAVDDAAKEELACTVAFRTL